MLKVSSFDKDAYIGKQIALMIKGKIRDFSVNFSESYTHGDINNNTDCIDLSKFMWDYPLP